MVLNVLSSSKSLKSQYQVVFAKTLSENEFRFEETSFFDEIEDIWDEIAQKRAHWMEMWALRASFLGTRNRLSNARENPFPGG